MDLSDAVLDAKRRRADPMADDLVAELLENGGAAAWDVTRLFAEMITNADQIPDGLPDNFKAYFRDNEALPEWADQRKLELGASAFNSHGPLIVQLLFCKALPLAYSCAKGAEVLLRTGRLTHQVGQGQGRSDPMAVYNRRIMETAQFVLNVMAPGGFQPHGRAIRTTQKVRLIHASIRYYLKNCHHDAWATEELGEPINQEDMAGTLMSFSYSMLEGMEQLGVDTTPEEADAYIHTWRVVGHFLGIGHDLLPDSVAEAKQLTERILERQTGPSDAGIQLTRTLIAYLKMMIPGFLFDRMPPVMIRHVIGGKRADMLKVGGQWYFLTKLMFWIFSVFLKVFDDIQDELPLVRRLYERVSRAVLQFLVVKENGYKRVTFFIPPSLNDDWQVQRHQ